MNERDSEQVARMFVEGGYTVTPSEFDADAILVNTCSVRDQAEQKALGKICLLYTSPSPRDLSTSRMPSSA